MGILFTTEFCTYDFAARLSVLQNQMKSLITFVIIYKIILVKIYNLAKTKLI